MLRIIMNKTQIAELIQRRRLQLLVHSCIYYAYNENLVTDDRWAADFKGFNHSTGYNLPFEEIGIRSKAIQLIRYSEKRKDE